jgi:hypothetical protein
LSGTESVLPIRKLNSSEDDYLQRQVARINRADIYARDIVLASIAPGVGDGWVRVHDAISELDGEEPQDENFDFRREEWAYLLGMAVGLRQAEVRQSTSTHTKQQAGDADTPRPIDAMREAAAKLNLVAKLFDLVEDEETEEDSTDGWTLVIAQQLVRQIRDRLLTSAQKCGTGLGPGSTREMLELDEIPAQQEVRDGVGCRTSEPMPSFRTRSLRTRSRNVDRRGELGARRLPRAVANLAISRLTKTSRRSFARTTPPTTRLSCWPATSTRRRPAHSSRSISR